MSSGNPAGVYRRGNVWWYSTGRGVRRSSGSRRVEDAIAQREQALALKGRVCFVKEWRDWVAVQRSDSNSWLRRAHSHMRRKSLRRGWIGCLTLEELTRAVLASHGRCALTGIEFERNPTPRHPFSISIDRIDSRLGYIPGNVRMVLLAVNIAMSHWGERSLRAIARALVGRELVEAQVLRENMDKHTVTRDGA